MRGDLATRQRIQEGRRIAVVPHQDREVAVPALPSQGLARNERGDLLSLVGARHVLQVIDLDVARRLTPAEMLVDSEGRFEALGVMRDERVGRVKDALRRAAILDQGDDLGVRVGGAE